MFNSLKEKLGALRQKISSAPEKEEVKEAPAPPKEEPRKAFKKAKAAAKAAAVEAARPEPARPAPEPAPVISAPRREEEDERFTDGILGRRLSESRVGELLDELEIALLESDVALPAVEAIKKRVKQDLVDRKVRLGTDVPDMVEEALKDAITAVLAEPVVLPPKARRHPSRFEPPFFSEFVDRHDKPVVLMFVGINGTGKTTTIAKIGHMLMKQGYSIVIAAGDTFRAGAIQQLEKHADQLGVKLIRHEAGSDPASVAYDAIEHARARRRDVVLVDTAGRMQTDTGLMEEMSKIERVANPSLVIYVGDALAGNDAVNEAMAFNRAVGVDAVVLTKVDADAKGGAALSIRYATGAPVIFVGTGQEYKDLEAFSPRWMVDRIFGAGA
ncbi:MAG: signal recognition particle-docking protein FtsY [Euryarchaeota archaeon]|nr:signal recognition particle-docking protein FtsY [Euryarchaeota archaeon]